jgi:hypothetical protein
VVVGGREGVDSENDCVFRFKYQWWIFDRREVGLIWGDRVAFPFGITMGIGHTAASSLTGVLDTTRT